ncbi:sulfurtransferase [Leifsonia sp. Le1]|uniref:sulfurtransferase n=1 Tax=Leifsonia sp. Le1 TaxID=3404918 RepID=UPI003EBE53B1
MTAHGPLVTTDWLAENLHDPAVVVLDATVLPVVADGSLTWGSGRAQFEDAHIPGALFADIIEEFSDPTGEFAFTRPGAAQFAAAASAHGIGADTTVVVSDASVGNWAARLWWLFRSFGHESVVVLDGGLTKWRSEGRQVESGGAGVVSGVGTGEPVARKRAAPSTVFVPAQRSGFWADMSDVRAVVDGHAQATLICGLAPAEFSGASGFRARRGHIPGSVNIPAGRLVSRETNAFLPPEGLRILFADTLASPDPIITYCGGGIAAASDALALALLGRDDVRIYDGSLNEWAADADAPLVVTA